MKKGFPGKQKFKRIANHCKICGENNYNLLDVHRITPGKEGGSYSVANSVVLCCSCHRKVHAEQIIIKGWFHSTGGRLLLIEENGEEKFI